MSSRKYEPLKHRRYDEEQEEMRYQQRNAPRNNNRKPYQKNFQKNTESKPDLSQQLKDLVSGSANSKGKKTDFHAGDDKAEKKISNKEPALYRENYQELKERLDKQMDYYQGRQSKEEKMKERVKQPIFEECNEENSWSHQNDKKDKSTSETNKKQEVTDLKEGDFPNIQQKHSTNKPETRPPRRGNREQFRDQPKRGRGNREQPREQLQRGHKDKEKIKDEEKQISSSGTAPQQEKILNWSSSSQEHQDDHNSSHQNGQALDSHDLSLIDNLLNQEESYLEQSSPKQESEQLPSKETLEATLKEISTGQKVKLSLVFQSEVNILEFRVKEVELGALGVMAVFAQNGEVKLKKNPDISSQLIENYISVIETSHYFPNMLHAPAEGFCKNPLAVEEDHQPIVFPRIEIELCSICRASENKEKSLVSIKLLMVRCMQCQKKNEVVVPASNELACSCNHCSAKIVGRIVEMRIEG